jgi:UDP-N-acetylmuramoylalanine--D-glutamate ligase
MVALLGYGKTTRAVAKELKSIVFFADVEKPFIDEDGFEVRPSRDYEPKNFDFAIPSPGLPPSHPLVRRSSKILSDYDLFFDRFPFTIWVSGTNGKTTTTQMITHLLAKRGAKSGGNIGTPVASLDPKAPIWVLETSSFTLHYTNRAKPNLYILLPITPDHLSWHGSFQEYEAAKLKPIQSLKEGEVAIVPKKYLRTPTNGFLIGYEEAKDLALYFGIDIQKIAFRGAFLLDALLACAVTKILFNECDYEAINAFSLDPHKQEEFYDEQGRLWVDDSKATNIDATLQAVKRYANKEIHLILGGDNKGVSLEPLIAKLPKTITIYSIGKAAKEISTLAKKYAIPCKKSQTLERAVEEIKRVHSKEFVALLSPACASFDQFSGYKDRGEKFKRLVLSNI